MRFSILHKEFKDFCLEKKKMAYLPCCGGQARDKQASLLYTSNLRILPIKGKEPSLWPIKGPLTIKGKGGLVACSASTAGLVACSASSASSASKGGTGLCL